MHSSQDDMEQDFLNIDAYFASANNDEDIWSNTSHGTDPREDADEEELLAHTRTSTTNSRASSPAKTTDSILAVKKEPAPERIEPNACRGCCGDEETDEESKLRIKTEAQHSNSSAATGATGDSGPDSMYMLDDGAWLDFDPQSTGAELASPTLMRRFGMDNRSAREDGDDTFLCDDDDDALLLGDVMDLPDFMDADVAELVPSPITGGSRLDSSTLTVSTSTSSRPALSRSALTSPLEQGGVAAPLPSPSQFPGHGSNSALVSDQDIPDMVNLFSSMYSPSESARQAQAQQNQAHSNPPAPSPNHQPPLSIMVPAPQILAATMFPFSHAAGSPMPQPLRQQPPVVVPANQFEFFTPPGVTGNRPLDPNSIFMSADSLSPPTKNSSIFQQAQQMANAMRPLSQTQAQQQMQAATAAAVAMANSAAAMNTMRKLNQTYGVPIAPLQRSISADAQPLKPKIINATATSATTIAATFGSSNKVAKISITPDISDFKLVQIFHNFCDPVTKVITLQRFHQLLQCHQGKDEHGGSQTTAAAAAAAAAAAKTNNTSKDNNTPTSESITLFKTLDKKNTGFLDLEIFMNSFQICNRCTEAKRRAHSAVCAAQGQSFVPTALERQLMEDVAPVIVRVVPTSYEGSKVKSCEHYQWTWCEGFDKTGNEKCKGTNRHDKCPKYLANCTLWKHKLPPKNRKSKIFENVESPSKKFKHFA